ncbi:MAG: response regulator, partial [Acidobacteriaceae bacterium]
MSLKVLLADDSMTAQNMGKKILAESGYNVTTVSNGAAAVKKIAEVKPDIVILDIYMPGYTGLEVCERVRANMDTANLPVLLTVGKMEPYRAEDGAKVRADGVIVKPFEATDLLAIVKKMAEKAPGNRRVVAEPEPEPEEEIGQPEPAMPASVEVPSELAAAPALVMEEFTPAQPEVAEFMPAMEWTVAAELPVEQASMPTMNPEPQLAEVPWSFDQVLSSPEQQPETANTAAVEPSTEIEFTSAPRTGHVEVEQADGLEAGLNAEPTADLQVARDPGLTDATEMTDFVTSFGETQPALADEVSNEKTAEAPPVEAPAEVSWDGWAQAAPTEAIAEAQPP